jgi:hypothetical protein
MVNMNDQINHSIDQAKEQILRAGQFRDTLEFHRFDIRRVGDALDHAYTWSSSFWGWQTNKPYLTFSLHDNWHGKVSVVAQVYYADMPLIRQIIAGLAQQGFYGSLEYDSDDDVIWIHQIHPDIKLCLQFYYRPDCILETKMVEQTVKRCPHRHKE